MPNPHPSLKVIAFILLFALLLPGSVLADAPQVVLLDPPRMPERPTHLQPVSTSASVALCSPPQVCTYLPVVANPPSDPRTRAYAVNLYNSDYLGSNGKPLGWTGNLDSCIPGTTSQAFRDSVLMRLNYYRQMAGLSKLTGMNPTYNTQDQAAALIMGANHDLSHDPPNNWKCWTQLGHDGAGSSNLALGVNGPAAIDLYINDPGTASLGHRRWVLYPQTQEMGTGDVTGSAYYNVSNALKAWDEHYGQARPNTLDPFVAWPPGAYVPYQVVYPVWSFAVAGADFSGATVTVTSNGANVPVTVSHPGNGFGENTLAFKACNCSAWPKPTQDTAYQVTIHNVVVSGVARDYTYTVTIIDPAK